MAPWYFVIDMNEDLIVEVDNLKMSGKSRNLEDVATKFHTILIILWLTLTK